jgi:UV DNA damage endonuclease
MKIGYPCINRSIKCRGNRTFRLASYSPERFIDVCAGNLDCLARVLRYNVTAGILFFRISSDLVPFASHPVLDVPWQEVFRPQLEEIGKFIRAHRIRISMHPDQFVVINSKRGDVVTRSVRELEYHADVLGLLGLGQDARIQIHVGGVYGDRPGSMERFIANYQGLLDDRVCAHLSIENDDRSYCLADCLEISRETGIPVIFDNFHHSLFNRGESVAEAMTSAAATWGRDHGLPMVDYSSQKPGQRPGTHADTIDIDDFIGFVRECSGLDFDIMLEIKDKEASALRAIESLRSDPRLVAGTDP